MPQNGIAFIKRLTERTLPGLLQLLMAGHLTFHVQANIAPGRTFNTVVIESEQSLLL